MKMILAIVSKDDADYVQQGLTLGGFQATKLATTGGFLRAGNATVIVGVDEDKVDDVISTIKEHSHRRKQVIPATSELGMGFFPAVPVEVTIGGATVFVVDVERFEKL